MTEIYKTNCKKLTGTDFKELHQKTLDIYKKLRRKSKRRTYIRSAYFKKDKIFLELFWQHLFDKKNWRDRARRIQYFSAGIDLIQNSRFEPKSKENPNKAGEIFHRFTGMTKEKDLFHVQIKENKKNSQKFLISIFPDK